MDALKESQHAEPGATQRRSALPESPAKAHGHGAGRALSADERLEWWRQARFGMFIHWGPYSILGGEWQGQRVDGGVGHGVGEWIMYNAQIPVADYAKIARSFNPQQFDADDWAQLAKRTGQKYLILTTKHHDGFAMFRTAASDYNIADGTAFGRDVVAELAAACARHGIRFGLYYSQAQDWHHAGGSAFNGLRDPNALWAGGDPAAGHWDASQKGDFDTYLQSIALPQVRELLTNYGPVDIFWWDTPIGMTPAHAQLFDDLLQLQPGIITNNRLLNPERANAFSGDTETPEQFIPATGVKGRAFEVCMTVNDTWGYKNHDHNWKPARQLIRQLVDTVSKGGNFLLNIGPDGEGRIPSPCRERLEAVGRWMSANGESINGAQPSVFAKLPWGRCTRRSKNGREFLYLHVLRWPQDGVLTVPGLRSPVLRAQLLCDGTQLEILESGQQSAAAVRVPLCAPDADVSVVRLEVEAPLKVTSVLPRQAEDGSLHLPAWQADIHNQPYCGQALLDLDAEHVAIRQWTDARTWLSWEVDIRQEGRFAVFADSQFLPAANRFQLSVRPLDADACDTLPAADDEGKVVGMSLDRQQGSAGADASHANQGDGNGNSATADISAPHTAQAADVVQSAEATQTAEATQSTEAAQASTTQRELGQLTFDSPGRYTLSLRPLVDGSWQAAELAALELRPLDSNA